MEVKVSWNGPSGMSFLARTGSGHLVNMDGAPDGGGHNLAPRPMMGSVSHGMLLCASDNNSMPYLVAPPDDAKPGFVVR